MDLKKVEKYFEEFSDDQIKPKICPKTGRMQLNWTNIDKMANSTYTSLEIEEQILICILLYYLDHISW